MTDEVFGDACIIEGDAVAFPQVGYTLAVLQPGQPSGMYHREDDQEDFLVLSGECLLLVEGEERRLQAWDFVHCPAGTEHIFVGAGEGPCVIFMAGGARPPRQRGLPAQRGRAAPRRRGRDRDDARRARPTRRSRVAAGAAGELGRPPVRLRPSWGLSPFSAGPAGVGSDDLFIACVAVRSIGI